MSKARLVITAVTVEKRPVSEVAKSYGVARSWVYALLARYQAEGEAAFEPRSRRPKTSPSAISDDAADLIVRLRKDLAGQGLDAGPQTIAWHLEHRHQGRRASRTPRRPCASSAGRQAACRYYRHRHGEPSQGVRQYGADGAGGRGGGRDHGHHVPRPGQAAHPGQGPRPPGRA